MPEKYYYPSLSRPLYVNFDYGIIFFFSFETVIIIFHLFTRGRFVRLPPSIERNSIGLTATRLGQGQTHQGGRRGTSGPKRRTAGKGLGKSFFYFYFAPLYHSQARLQPSDRQSRARTLSGPFYYLCSVREIPTHYPPLPHPAANNPPVSRPPSAAGSPQTFPLTDVRMQSPGPVARTRLDFEANSRTISK